MKKLAKVLSLALVLVMVLSLGGNAWADGHTITIKVPTNDKAAHTFNAYQIFTGTIEQGDAAAADTFTDETSGTSVYPDRTLFNAQWGSALTGSTDVGSKTLRESFVKRLVDTGNAAFAALVSQDGEGNKVYSTDAADVAEAIGTIGDITGATDLSSLIARFIAYNNIHPIKTAGRTSGAEQVALTELPDGYYFIEDTVASGETKPYAISRYILQLLSDVTLKSKTEVPSSNKKVDDKNDSSTSEDAVTWQDSADYDVGDTIPYKLTAFIPVNVFDTYDWYNLAFYDDMCEGLTFNSDAKVTAYQIAGTIPEDGRITKADRITGTALYLDDVDIDAETKNVDSAIGDSSYTNGNKYRFDLGNMLDYNGDYYLDLDNPPLNATAAYVVVEVAYTATLNDNAKINAAGNPNKSHIEFSNNPNDNSAKGTTPDDEVTVFTFKAVINKVDGNNQPLNTAGFRFDKLLASYKVTAEDVANKVYIVDGTKKYLLDKPEDGKAYTKTSKGAIIQVEEAKKDSDGNTAVTQTAFAANDLLENVYVTIPLDHTASTNVFTTHKIDAGTYQITETVTPDGYNPIEPFALELVATHSETSDTPELTAVSAQGWTLNENWETENDTYTVTKNVVNRSGAELPSTGGVGTTLFYVFGSMLVIAAAVYFVTKKRSEVE